MCTALIAVMVYKGLYLLCVCVGVYQSVLEVGQQLRVCREQLQESAQDLQEAHARSDALSRQLDDITEQERRKVQALHSCTDCSTLIYAGYR